MRNKTLCSLMAAALFAGVAACGEQISYPVPPVEEFTASLTGANEVPPVTTGATGSVLFAVAFDTILSYRIEVAGVDSTTAIRIYSGAAGAAGADTLVVLFTGVACRDPATGAAINVTSPSCRLGYTGTINPNQFKASQLTRIPLSYGATARERFDALLALMRAGTAHVNIHTKASPNGNIRGQIQPLP